MGSTIITFKAHDNKIFEIWYTDLTDFLLSRKSTSITRYIKDDRLLFHKAVFFKRFGKVNFGTKSFGFDLFNLLLSVFFVVTHGNKLL